MTSEDGLVTAGVAGWDLVSGSLEVLHRERGKSGFGWAWQSWRQGTSHLPARVQPVGWDGVRTWGELVQPEPPAPTELTPLHPGERGCWLEGAQGMALPPGQPHHI